MSLLDSKVWKETSRRPLTAKEKAKHDGCTRYKYKAAEMTVENGSAVIIYQERQTK